jgi:choline kinase
VSTQIVILAAGMGSRLGRSLPKPLTELSDGRTIMQQQFDNIHHAFGSNARVTIVVGYKLEHIVEAHPEASFVYNEQYDQTNTSKSLMRALQSSAPGGVLWMNGDVVFDPTALERAAALVARDQ